jgi:hypothetical protein
MLAAGENAGFENGAVAAALAAGAAPGGADDAGDGAAEEEAAAVTAAAGDRAAASVPRNSGYNVSAPPRAPAAGIHGSFSSYSVRNSFLPGR